jgi:hypothetical protein
MDWEWKPWNYDYVDRIPDRREQRLAWLLRSSPGTITRDIGKPIPTDQIPPELAGKPIKDWTAADLGTINHPTAQTALALLHIRDQTVSEIMTQNYTRTIPAGTKDLLAKEKSKLQAIIDDPRGRSNDHDFGAHEKLMAEKAQAAYLRPRADPTGKKMERFIEASGIGEAGYRHVPELSHDLAQVFVNEKTGRMSVAWRGSLDPVGHPQDWIKNGVNAVGLHKVASKIPGTQSKAEVALRKRIAAYAEEKGYRIDTTGHSRGGASAGQFERAFPGLVDSVRTYNTAPFEGDHMVPQAKARDFSIEGDVVSVDAQLKNQIRGVRRTIPPAYGKGFNPLKAHGIDQFTGLKDPNILDSEGRLPQEEGELTALLSDMKRPNERPVELRAIGASSKTSSRFKNLKRAGAIGTRTAGGVGVGMLVNHVSESVLSSFGFQRGENFAADEAADAGVGGLTGLVFGTPGATAAGFMAFDAMHQLLQRLHVSNAGVAFGSAGVAIGAERLAGMALTSAGRRVASLAARRAGWTVLKDIAVDAAERTAVTTGWLDWIPGLGEVLGASFFVGSAVYDLMNMNAEDRRAREEALNKQVQEIYSEMGSHGLQPSMEVARQIAEISNNPNTSTEDKTRLVRLAVDPEAETRDAQIRETFGEDALVAYNRGDPAWARQSTQYGQTISMLQAARAEFATSSGLKVPHVSEAYHLTNKDFLNAADAIFEVPQPQMKQVRRDLRT